MIMEARKSVLPMAIDSFYLKTDKEIFSARPIIDYSNGWIQVTAFSEKSRFTVKIHNNVTDGDHDFAGPDFAISAVYDFDNYPGQGQKMEAETGLASVAFDRISGNLSVDFSCASSQLPGFSATNGSIQLTTTTAYFPGWLKADVNGTPFNTEIVTVIKESWPLMIVAAHEPPENPDWVTGDRILITLPSSIEPGKYPVGLGDSIKVSYAGPEGAGGRMTSGQLTVIDTDAKRIDAQFECEMNDIKLTNGWFNVSSSYSLAAAPGSGVDTVERSFSATINDVNRTSSTLVFEPTGTLIVELEDDFLTVAIPPDTGAGEYKIVPVDDPNARSNVRVRYDGQGATSGTINITSIGWGKNPFIKASFNCTDGSLLNIQDAVFEITPGDVERALFTAVLNEEEIIATRVLVVDMATSKLLVAYIGKSPIFEIQIGKELADDQYAIDAEHIIVIYSSADGTAFRATKGTLSLSTSPTGVRSGTLEFDHPGYRLADGKFSLGNE